MAKSRRVELDTKLREILGSGNVYYRAPESIKMHYPAFRYQISGMNQVHADNRKYINTIEYEVIHIDKDPDNDVYEIMNEEFDKCRFARRYMSDNLVHDVFYVYW